jgi:hypothetical protein
MSWKPITKEELEKELESQCSQLSKEERSYFNAIRVPLEPAKIERWGNLETVYIVAKKGSTIIFYEDVEEGFEISKLDKKGIVSEYGVNQFTIQHIVNQLRAIGS